VLTLRSQAPVFHNRLSFTPGRLLPLQRHELELALGLNHANIWAQMPGYFFDGEWTQAALRGAWGLGHGLEITAEIPVYGRSGGFLDSSIMAFHSAFGATQSRRERYPKNALRVENLSGPRAGTYLTDAQSGVGLANPSLGVRKLLGHTRDAAQLAQDAAFVAEFDLKLPLGSVSRQFASQSFEVLLALGAQQAVFSWLVVYMHLGSVFSPTHQYVYGMELSYLQKFALLGMGFELSPSVRLVLQYLNQDGAVERPVYAPLSATTHEFAVGAQWVPRALPRLLVELGILENSIHDANTADFGLHLLLRWRFDLAAGSCLAAAPTVGALR
jgi:hypothetical protein